VANWPLLLFIFYAGVSLIWSQNISRSTHTFFIFIAASASAAGLVTIYSRENILKLLFWFTGLAALVSLAVVVIYPQAGISQEFWLAQTWRGIFSHKNYFGTVMSFGSGLFLFAFLQGKILGRYFSLGFYFFTSFLVIMSRSATGLMCLILLSGVTLTYFLWFRYRKFLQPKHYIFLIILLALASAIVFLNVDPLLSLIGKNESFTGRVPLWNYLLHDVVSLNPWFGYGLETTWYDREFQIDAGRSAGWGIVVVNSHNGFMDILIYLGVFGLGIFMVVVIQNLIRVFQYAIRSSQPLDFIPLLILMYVLVANITISYFVEFENFHWLLFVMTLFMTTKYDSSIDVQLLGLTS
jgi:O-antigen ligase